MIKIEINYRADGMALGAVCADDIVIDVQTEHFTADGAGYDGGHSLAKHLAESVPI
jgi:hypothetical protein